MQRRFGAIGVVDGFKYLSAQAHVEGFFGQDVGIQTARDVGLAEVILSPAWKQLQNTVDVLIVDHAEDEMQLIVLHISQLTYNLGDACHVVARVGDGERVFAEDLPTAHQMGVADDLGDAVANVVFRKVELVAE